MTEELKPCPCAHCGKPAFCFDNTYRTNGGEAYVQIRCRNCRVELKQRTKHLSAKDLKQKLIEVWNRRASPWVRMADKKPDEGQEVFIKVEGGDYLYSRGEYFEGKFFGVHFLEGESWIPLLEKQVTHWMPIPEIEG